MWFILSGISGPDEFEFGTQLIAWLQRHRQCHREAADEKRTSRKRVAGFEFLRGELDITAVVESDDVEAELVGATVGGLLENPTNGLPLHFFWLAVLVSCKEYV